MPTAQERDAMRRRVVIADKTVCYHCKRTGLTAQDQFCPDCGFPQAGTQQQQYAFIVRKRRVRSELEDSQRMVDKARFFLFAVAVLNVFTVSLDSKQVVASSGIVSLAFVGLGIWSRKAPFAALLTGAILYISLQLFIAIAAPFYFFVGLLFKILITGGLLYGVYAAKNVERLRKEL